MLLMSWNINGIRSCLSKGFEASIRSINPDILCLQEVRATREQAEFDLPEYDVFWNDAEKKGYSGTAILTKKKPKTSTFGLGIDKHDHEGRVITLEFDTWHLVTVYTPNAQRDLARLPYRSEEWDVDFLAYVTELQKKKPVVFCGDLNVSHKEIDLARPKPNIGNAGFTTEERAGFDHIIEAGFIDTFRAFTSDGGHYTWWSNFGQSRAKNIGWRIDYFCISAALRPKLKAASILPDITGSDHCPITVDMKL